MHIQMAPVVWLSLACFICHLSKSLQFTNVRAGAFIADDPLGLL